MACRRNKNKKVNQLTSEIANKLADMHTKISKQAQEVGYARDTFKSLVGYFNQYPENIELKGTETVLTKYRDYLDEKAGQIIGISGIDSTAYSTVTVAVSGAEVEWAAAAPSVTMRKMVAFKPPLNSPPDRTKYYSELLDKIDQNLAKSYRSIWETYYGTTDARKKSALFAMRQFYDEFFAILAPEDNVKLSKFHKPPKPPEVDKVTRRERLLYASNTHIKDEKLSELLTSQVGDLIETYQKLNHLHIRGEIDETLVEEVLESMRSSLEGWIDAIS